MLSHRIRQSPLWEKGGLITPVISEGLVPRIPPGHQEAGVLLFRTIRTQLLSKSVLKKFAANYFCIHSNPPYYEYKHFITATNTTFKHKPTGIVQYGCHCLN